MDVAQFSRLEIKSELMFAIWDTLKETAIEIPFPQRDIHIPKVAPDNAGNQATMGSKPELEKQPA